MAQPASPDAASGAAKDAKRDKSMAAVRNLDRALTDLPA
jgi:hypothetical protein